MVGDQSETGCLCRRRIFSPLESTTIPYGAAQGAREMENSGWRRGVYGIKKKLLIMCAREIPSSHLVTDQDVQKGGEGKKKRTTCLLNRKKESVVQCVIDPLRT